MRRPPSQAECCAACFGLMTPVATTPLVHNGRESPPPSTPACRGLLCKYHMNIILNENYPLNAQQVTLAKSENMCVSESRKVLQPRAMSRFYGVEPKGSKPLIASYFGAIVLKIKQIWWSYFGSTCKSRNI